MSEKKQSKHQPETVKDWLDKKKWVFKLEGPNYKVQNCPYCPNTKFNFEVHKDRGMAKCWACGIQASFYNLRKHVDGTVAPSRIKSAAGDNTSEETEDEKKITPERMEELTEAAEKFHSRLEKRVEAYDYIKGRGFTDETLEHFKIGAQSVDGKLWLVIPHIENGKAVNLKYRNLHGGKIKWRQEKDTKKVLYNMDAMLEFDDSIIIVEGELKTAALWQVGIRNVVGLPQGVDTFKTSWVDQLEKYTKIYLCLDTDTAGQGACLKLATRLGMDRCYNIVLTDDAKDPDEWLFEKGHTPEEFVELMRQAKLMDVPNILTMDTAFRFLEEEMDMEDAGGNSDGLKTKWPSVNEIARGFKGGNLIIITSPPKVGKCVAFNTKVINPDTGEMLTIEEAVKHKMKRIHSYNENTGKIEIREISHWYDSGIKKLLNLETKLGNSITTTHHHPYLTPNGWKQADEIKVGDYIALPTKQEVFGTVKWSKEECFIIGSLIADGGLTCGSVSWTKKEPSLIIKMRHCAKTEYGLKLKTAKKCTHSITHEKRGLKNALLDRIRQLEMDKLSKNKTIPKEVFTLEKGSLREFLGAIWSGDGSIHKNGIEYSSASEQLIDELQHLFLRFGIMLKKSYKSAKLNEKRFHSWKLSSGQKTTIENFASEIPLTGLKKTKLKNLLLQSQKAPRDYITSYPIQYWDLVKEEVNNSIFTMANISDLVGSKGFKTNGGISRFMLEKINKHLKSEAIQKLINQEICFVKITSKKDEKPAQCYDLTVPGTHTFLAQGIVAHNTTMALDMTLDWAQNGIPGLFFCMEMGPKQIVRKIATNILGVDDINITREDITHTRTILRRKPFYVLDRVKALDKDKVFQLIRDAHKRYGLSWVVFDNLHFLVRGTENLREKVGEVSQGFKLLAEELQLPVFLIVHPRKLKGTGPATSDDLKESSAIHADADMVIVLHRNRVDNNRRGLEEDEGILSAETQVIVDAHRYGPGGTAKLHYDGAKSKFLEITV